MSTQWGRECWCSRDQYLNYNQHGPGVCDSECSGDKVCMHACMHHSRSFRVAFSSEVFRAPMEHVHGLRGGRLQESHRRQHSSRWHMSAEKN